MLIHAWNVRGADDLTQAENEMIIGEVLRFGFIRTGESQHLRIEINGLDGSPAVLDVATEVPDGIQNVTGFDTTGHNLRQQRLEEEVVLAANQDDFGRIVLPEQAPEPARRLNACKPATHNDNSGRRCLSAECGRYRILMMRRPHRISRDISSKHSHLETSRTAIVPVGEEGHSFWRTYAACPPGHNPHKIGIPSDEGAGEILHECDWPSTKPGGGDSRSSMGLLEAGDRHPSTR